MALDAATAQEMLHKLAEDREQYLVTLNRAHNILAQTLAAAGADKTQVQPSLQHLRRNTADTFESKTTWDAESTKKGSSLSFEDETDSESDESLFVQQELPPERFDEQGLRKHILEYDWPDESKQVIEYVMDDKDLFKNKRLFSQKPEASTDFVYFTHHSIFDVGGDGAPLEVLSAADTGKQSKAQIIWNSISELNDNPDKERKAVGRITIVREPSPLLFAALHYTMNKHFDVDELYKFLVDLHTEVKQDRPCSPSLC